MHTADAPEKKNSIEVLLEEILQKREKTGKLLLNVLAQTSPLHPPAQGTKKRKTSGEGLGPAAELH